MSGGGSFNRSSSKGRTTPWSGLQPYLKDIYGQAQQQYRGGVPAYYPGQTFVGFNPIEQQAMAMQQQRAGGSPQEQQLAQYISGQLGQPGVNIQPGVQAATQAASGTAGGQQALAAQAGGLGLGQTQQFAQGGTQNPFLNQLGATAAGENLEGNPYLDAQFKRASEQVGDQFRDITSPGIASTFGAAGRTGSGLQQAATGQAQQELAGELSGLATDIYGQNYQRERERQLTAQQFGAGQGLAQQQLAANLYGGSQQRALQAGQGLLSGGLQGAGALGNLYGQVGQQQQAAAGMVPGLSALQYQNIGALRGVGQDVRGLQEQALGAEMDRFNYYQQAPQDALARYAAIIQAQALQQSKTGSSGWGMSGYGGVGASGG